MTIEYESSRDNTSVVGETLLQRKDMFTAAEISPNARVVLGKRYLRKNQDGDFIEDSEGMFRRVARGLANVEKKYGASQDEVDTVAERFYQLMSSLDYLPNSPTLMNAGTGSGTLSACFVLPLQDTMSGIMDAARNTALVQKFGGGTGFALTEIRPKGMPIATTHGKACGPIAVLRHLSSVSTLVTQGGKRDGANMAVMDIHHPDIIEFIGCKEVEGEIHNFNISVGASDEFMEAVENGTDYPLRTKKNPADPSSPMVEVARQDAREVFAKIVDGAWRNGEPGMIFLDEVNRDSPVLHIGRITATNPCGEQPLLPNESCNLGSINMAHFVIADTRDGFSSNQTQIPDITSSELSEKERYIDWYQLAATVRTSIHMLDNVIDANQYAVPEIEEMTKATRKLGLGVMGFADMLIMLGVRYDSTEGIQLGRKVMRFIQKTADGESRRIAETRGAFPAWDGSILEQTGHTPLRNACRLTVAPTGTISMIAGCSSGIEPIFSLVFRKQNILDGETLYYVDRNFEITARERGFYSDELMDFLANGGSLQDRDDVPQEVKDLFRVAADISPEDHVRMQAAFQESTDAAISKTINFPNEADHGDVETAYMLAWQLKCKGITVYRAGSREREVLTSGTGNSENTIKDHDDELTTGYLTPADRPSEVSGITRRVHTGHGNIYVTVNTNSSGRPFEVFATAGKAGGCDAAQHQAIGRMVSLALRSGIDPEEIVKELRDITCCPAWDNGVLVRSGPDAIALALDQQLQAEIPSGPKPLNGQDDSKQLGMSMATAQPALSGTQARVIPEIAMAQNEVIARLNQNLCPECGQSSLAHQEGCLKCLNCGYSKC